MRTWLLVPALVVGSMLLLPGATAAQTPAPGARGRIVVHGIQTIPDQVAPNTKVPGLGMKVTFSVLDAGGRIRQDESSGAELRIGNTVPYLNNVVQVKKRWAIVVLMDASATFGSQPGIYNTVRDKVLTAIDGTPEGANIELMTFAEGAETVRGGEFSTNKDAVKKALFDLRPRPNGNSCLNEGLYSAVRRLGTIGADTNVQRKAVLVVTGSVDNCGRRNVAAVLDEAKNQNVNIYGVGINGLVARESDLRQFTDPTNGFLRMTAADNSNFALGTILEAMGQQHETGFTVYVPAGKQKADLTIRFKDGTSVNDEIAFDSDKNYAPPAKIDIVGAPRTSAGVRVNLEYRDSENVKQVQILVLDKAEGRETSVPGCTFNQETAEPLQTVFCPFSFGRSGEYAVRARALDSNGRELAKSELFDVKGQAAVGTMAIERLDYAKADPEAITVTLARANLDGIDRYLVEMLDPNGNSVAKSATVIAPGARPLVMKVDNTTAAGSYKLRVRALDSQNRPLPDIAPAESQDTVAIYWRSALERIWEDVRRNPWVFAIAAVALLISVSGLFGIIRLMRSRAYARAKPVELALPEVVRRAAPKDQSSAYTPLIAETPSQVVKKPAGDVSAAMPVPKPQPAPGAAAVNMPSLVVVSPPEVQYSAPLVKSPFTVGRKDGGDNAALPIDHTYGVSRSHITLVMVGGAWSVRDDRSSNGTTINGKPLERGKLVKLNADDTLGLGPKIKLQFKMPKV